MANNALHRVVEQAKANRRRNRWNKVVTGMAAFVVFCTTYALILPAITEEREPLCGLEEHVHEDKCWELPKVITCPYERKAENGELPLLVHTHDAFCYDTLGNLICAMPEVESHVHDYGCYTEIVPEAPHVHSDACYTEEKVLICTLEESEGHTHDESCDGEVTALICQVPESEGHAHGEGCYDEAGTLICELPESEGHTHGDSCYGTAPGRVCGLEESEGHVHTDECYVTEKVLTCGKTEATPEELAAYTGEPEKVLTCEKKEIILHQHSEACRDEDGNLICGLNELFAHQHTKECLTTTKDPEAEKVLVCGFKEEHTHDDTCYTDLDADLETPEMWEAGLPELTDHWADDLIAVALTQLGYSESTENVTVSPEGLISGYTRYGQWAGSPYGPWSLTFVDFCQHYAGIPADAFPVHEGQLRWCEQLKEENWNMYWSPDQYTPVPGDMVLLDLDVDGKMDSEAIVLELTEATEETAAKLVVIQGDVEGSVQKSEYDPADPVILGYASTTAARSRWDLLNPAPEPEPVRYCGLEAHTHGPECYDAEENLICQLPEHTHDDACLIPPVVYYCGMEEHTHDENCYDNEGTMTCTLQEHTHEALCQVAQKYFCGMEEHIHEDACYDENNVLTCGKEAHTHDETCQLAQQTIEAQIEAPATLELDEEEPEEQTVVRVSGLIPNGAVVKAVPVDLSDLYEGFVCAYDISIFTAQGKEFQPVIPLKVTFDIPGQSLTEEDDVSICYVPKLDEPEDGKIYSDALQEMTSQINEDGNLTFDAPHFTTYMQRRAVSATDSSGPGYSVDENYIGGPVCDDNCDHIQIKLANFVRGDIANPFGEALNYNLFLLDDLTDFGTIHGNAAIGGNIVGSNQGITKDEGSTMDYSNDLVPKFDLALVLGGKRTPEGAGDIWAKNGSVVTCDQAHRKIQMLFSDRDHRHVIAEDNPLLDNYFASAYEALVGNPNSAHSDNHKSGINSEFYQNCLQHDGETEVREHGGQADSIDANYPGNTGDLILVGTDPFVNIFNIEEKYLRRNGGNLRQWIVDVPYGSYTMINIIPNKDGSSSGEIDDFGISMWTRINDGVGKDNFVHQPSIENGAMAQAQRTIINFAPQFETLKCAGTEISLYASILAPDLDLDVTASGAHVDLWGTIVLESIACGGSESSALNPSAIMYYPYQAPGSARMVKSIRCDADPIDDEGCQINDKIDWQTDEAQYYADVTIEATNLKNRAVNRFEIKELPLNQYTKDFDLKKGINIDYFAPGSYRVIEERVYKVLPSGEKLYVDEKGYLTLESGMHCDASGNPYYFDENDEQQAIEDHPEKFVYDPILGAHTLSYAAFKKDGGDEYGTVTIESSQNAKIEVVNHYDKVSTNTYAVRKLWQRPLTDEEKRTDLITKFPDGFMPAPIPEGASVKVQLYQVRTEKISGESTTVTYGNPIVLNNKNNWNYVWLGLPKTNPKGNIICTYYAREIEPWEGYEMEHEDFPDDNLTVIKNKKRTSDEHFLTVDKFWFDENGVLDENPREKSLSVKLWRDTGHLKNKPSDAHQVRFYVGSVSDTTPPPIYIGSHTDRQGSGCFDGSDLKVSITCHFADVYQDDCAIDLVRFYANGLPLPTEMSQPVQCTSKTGGYLYKVTYSTTLTNISSDMEVTLVEPTSSIGTLKELIKDPNAKDFYGNSLYPQIVPIEYPKFGEGHILWDEKVELLDTQILTKDAVKGNWSYTWGSNTIKLTKPDDTYGFVYYRYYVTEQVPKDYTPTYKVTGLDETMTADQYLKLGALEGGRYDSAGSNGGIPEGYITISNAPVPPGGPELPMTGGAGTVLYTLGGLLTAALAGILLQYNHRKRGKEGNAF